MLPTKMFVIRGVGTHKEDKNARDAASRTTGVGDKNLVTVSSVLPAGIEEISREEFDRIARPGEIVHAIHGVCESNKPGQLVVAGLALARPVDRAKPGYVTELYENPGIPAAQIRERVETMALQLYAEENGVEDFTAAGVWEEGKGEYEIGGSQLVLDSVIAEGQCNLDGDWTCALVGVVLLE